MVGNGHKQEDFYLGSLIQVLKISILLLSLKESTNYINVII